MANPVTIYRGTTGLTNRIDPARLKVDADTGVTPVAAAYNVDVDDSGRISRRKGFEQVYAGDTHSVFCNGWDCLFVQGSVLYKLNPDYSTEALRSDLTAGARMAFLQVNDEVYYCNGHENGVIRNGADAAWTALDYVGPTTTKVFSSPPVGDDLELYNARVYIVDGTGVWYTERFAYSWVNLARNYLPFASRVQMFKAVTNGIYASNEDETFFLAGEDPDAGLQIRRIADYPAIKGTAVKLSAGMVGPEGLSGDVVIWTSSRGICLGGPDGMFKNLTERRLVLPSANFGAGLYKDGKYIATLQP